MANAANTRNVRNSKSRQYAQDRNKFGGSSAPSETVSEKSSLRYGLKDIPKKEVPTEKSSLRYGLKDIPKKEVPTEKSSLRYGLKDIPKKDVPAEKSSLRYGLKDIPKDTSNTAAVKDKMVSGLEKSAKKVPAYETIKGIPTSKVATGLGRAAMLEAGPAIVAGTLAESAGKYGRERGFGFQPRDVPKSSMSKKSDPIVDAINSDSDASTRAKSREANREAMYGSQKDVSKESSPDVEIKKTEIVKTAPVASRKTTPSAMKPKGPTEGDRARAAIESMRSQYESGDLYNKAGIEKSAKDAADMSKYIDSDKPEDLPANGMKKGGMTKRPPKPAKKVPPRKFASGGSVSRTSASKRGDGCATKGHTKGKYL